MGVFESNLSQEDTGPVKVDGDIICSNRIIKLGQDILFKPILFESFKEEMINTKNRKFNIDNAFLETKINRYRIELPSGYRIEKRPMDFFLDNDFIYAKIQYIIKENQIEIEQHTEIKKLSVEKEDFELWVESLTKIMSQFNKTILLKKI